MTHDEACRILKVPLTANPALIRKQYRRLASRYHPDRFFTASERDAATERFQAIAAAYALLQQEARSGKGNVQNTGTTSQPFVWARGTRRPEPAPTNPWAQQPSPDWPDTQAFGVRESGTMLPERKRWSSGVDSIARNGSSLERLLLIPLLLPSIIAASVARPIANFAQNELVLPDALSNLLATLLGHLGPGFLGLEIGHAFIQSTNSRSALAIAYGFWWVISGLIAWTLDGQAVG